MDDTENGVPVTSIASNPPSGADRITPTTVISGNFRFLYRKNRIAKIRMMVTGSTTFICARDAVYSSNSPPHRTV